VVGLSVRSERCLVLVVFEEPEEVLVVYVDRDSVFDDPLLLS